MVIAYDLLGPNQTFKSAPTILYKYFGHIILRKNLPLHSLSHIHMSNCVLKQCMEMQSLDTTVVWAFYMPQTDNFKNPQS